MEYSEWFVIQAYAGKENFVKEQIESLSPKKLDLLLPRRKLMIRRCGKNIETVKPLYPGYLLYKSYDNKTHQMVYGLKKEINGFIKILQMDNEPVPILYNEYEQIDKLINDEQMIDYSYAVLIGKRIQIVGGPLEGEEGIIRKVDKRKGRLKVALNFLGSERLVDLSFSMVETLVD